MRAAPSCSGTTRNLMYTKVGPGKLGLTVQFIKSKLGAVITNVRDTCPFKDEVKVGYRIVTMDRIRVSKLADLSIGQDNPSRTIGIVRDQLPEQ